MSEIGVVGTNEFILGFRLAGIRKVVEADEKGFLDIVRAMMDDAELGIIIVDEHLFNTLDSNDVYDLEKSVKPVILSLSENASQDNLRRMIKKSVGVDLWKNEGE